MIRVLATIFLAPAVLALSAGCSMLRRDEAPTPSSEPLTGSPEARWNQVADGPPTFLPRGVPTDHPTGSLDGEWIVDRESGTRFFVPFDLPFESPTRDQLLAEALSMAETQRSMTEAAVDAVVPDADGALMRGLRGVGNRIRNPFGGGG